MGARDGAVGQARVQQEREWYTAAAVEHSLLPHPVNLTAGRTLRAWHEQLRAYFATGVVSSDGTKAIDGGFEKPRRIAHGFPSFTNYRLRMLLIAVGLNP